MRVTQAVKADVCEVGQNQTQGSRVADVFEGFANVFQQNSNGKYTQEKPQTSFDRRGGEMPGGKINRHHVDADKNIIEAQVTNPNRVVGQERRRYQQNGCNQAVNNAQYRSTDSDVIRLSIEYFQFHTIRFSS